MFWDNDKGLVRVIELGKQFQSLRRTFFDDILHLRQDWTPMNRLDKVWHHRQQFNDFTPPSFPTSIISYETLSFLTSHHATNPINFACARFSRFSVAFVVAQQWRAKQNGKKCWIDESRAQASREEMARYFFQLYWLESFSFPYRNFHMSRERRNCTLFTLLR